MQKHHFPSSQLNGPKDEYRFVVSERLGRSSYKEQYAFIYRWVSPLCQQVSLSLCPLGYSPWRWTGGGFEVRELKRCRLCRWVGLCLDVGIIPADTSVSVSIPDYGPGSRSENGVSVRPVSMSHECDIPYPVHSAAGKIRSW